MNSNVVYGGAMPCHSGIGSGGTGSADYHHHQAYNHHFNGDLATYYPPPTSDLLNGSGQHNLSSSTPPTTHYSPPGAFHTPASLHSFSESGVIAEPGGLSYTNLDSSPNSYSSNSGPHSHYSRISPYSSSAVASSAHGSSQCSSQLSSTTNHPNIYSHSQPYREYGSSGDQSSSSPAPTVKSEYASSSSNQNGSSGPHHELMTTLPECSLARSSSSSSGHYPNYLDQSLITRSRNGTSLHHSMHLQNGLSSAYVDPTSHYSEMTCNQLNGSYHHHLNHLTNHLQSSHHHSSNPRNSNQNSNSSLLTTAPVPQYKWMQVKRNIPKPGKQCYGQVYIASLAACQLSLLDCRTKKLEEFSVIISAGLQHDRPKCEPIISVLSQCS